MQRIIWDTFINKYLWIICLVLGTIGAAIIWFALPHSSEIDTIWLMLFKIFVFVIICMFIALFPNTGKHKYILVCLPFLFFLAYLIPRLSYYGFFVDVLQDEKTTGEYYTLLYLLLYPSIMLTTCWAYRLGGGSSGTCLKISLIGTILIFSGFLDIMWTIFNPFETPEVLRAQHIKVIVGKFVTYNEAIIFTLSHIPLLVGICFLPLDKWMSYLGISQNTQKISCDVKAHHGSVCGS